MQRKALKQLGKVTQWTSEKVFSGEKTNLSSDFTDFEKEIDVRRLGIERLHATSLPFFNQLTKVKPTADPYPPPGSGKDKITYTEALGLVMIDYGDEIGEEYGDGLSKYGRARCRLAAAQEDFSARLGDGYIAGMEAALAAVNEYKSLRKKLDSRRLALDAAISKSQTSKKDHQALEEEVTIAKARFEEIEEETQQRMIGIQETEERQIVDLKDLLEAELEYHSRCHDILKDLHSSWGSSGSRSVTTRARSNTATSSKSLGRTAVTRSHTSRHGLPQSSEDDEGTVTANRSRSHSNASSTGKTKEKRSMLPSFGSFGKKSGLAATPSSHKKKSSYSKDKYNNSRTALNSDDGEEEEDEDEDRYGGGSSYGRTRSMSQLSASSSIRQDTYNPPPAMRRALTSPPNPTARYADPSLQYVKALYDYSGNASDELNLKVGQVIEVKTQVSDDWWIGECDGKSGLFPKAYTEEYVPSPQTAVPPPMPARRMLPPSSHSSTTIPTSTITRTMPPPAPPITQNNHHIGSSPVHGYGSEFDFESELESDTHGFSDTEQRQTASLAAEANPIAQTRERSNTLNKKSAPPPPPSRRSASSNNLLTTGNSSFGTSPSLSNNHLTPPLPIFGRNKSATTTSKVYSPFAGSEDEENSDDNRVYTNSRTSNNGLSTGLSSMHLSKSSSSSGDSNLGVNTDNCGICGCQDFTQNVFKSKGTCSTCFHAH